MREILQSIDDKNIGIMLERLFWILFGAFVLIIIMLGANDIYLGIFKSVIYPKGHTWGVYSSSTTVKSLSFVISVLFYLCTIFILSKIPKYINKYNMICSFILVTIVCLMLRLLFIFAFGLEPTYNSDVLESIKLSKETFPLDFPKFSSVSSWAIWPIYLRGIYKIFGDVVFPGLILNAIYASISCGILFYLIVRVSGNFRCGIISSILFMLWPTHLFWSISLRPEYVSTFLILLGLFFLCFSAFDLKSTKKHIYFCIICFSAMCIAFAGFFKRVDSIAIIALFLTFIICILKNNDLKQKLQQNKYLIGVGLLLWFSSYVCVITTGYAFLDKCYINKVNRNPSAHYVYVGLTPLSDGTAHPEKKLANLNLAIYRSYAKNSNFDYEKATSLVWDKLKNEIKEYKNLTPVFFLNKLRISWANQAYYNFITAETGSNSLLNRKNFYKICYPLSQIWYVFLLLFMLYASVNNLVVKSDSLSFFSALFIFGFMIVLLIVETQPRYKCVVYPFMCILAGQGIDIVCDKIQSYNSVNNL